MPQISIITINYNNANGLNKTLESVFSQKTLPQEYLIIDGGSTDGSKDLIQNYSNQLTWWLSEEDKGIYDAMNKGIRKAQGDYLMFLNSGDCLCDPSVLQRTYERMVQSPGADVYYGDIFIVNDKKGFSKHPWHHPETIDLPFLRRETINHQASLINAKLFKEFGLYPLEYKMAADYWLWLTCLLHDKIFRHVGFPMIQYDLSGESSANRSLYLQQKGEIWNSLVSKSVDELILENDDYKQLLSKKVFKVAARIHKRLQALKGNK